MPPLILPVLFVFLLAPAWAEQHLLRILHVNDFHGFAEAHKPPGSPIPLGGIAYLAGEVGRLRAEENSVLLAAGDMIRGNDWADCSNGRSVIEVMNSMKFDAMVVGNHEFDFGQAELGKRIGETAFPVLGANVTGMAGLRPYTIKELDGTRVAIIGVVTEYAPESTHPRNVRGLRFSSPAEAVKRYVNEVRGKADIIIVLSHIGYAADRELAAQVNGIDVIVGGHSHTKLEKPAMVNGVIIVQAWEHAKTLGVLDLTVKDGKIVSHNGYLDEIRPDAGNEDGTIRTIVQKFRSKCDESSREPIGVSAVDLDGEHVRTRETNLGNLVSDVMRRVSGADAAIMNGGGIRAGISKGVIRTRDIYASLPFDSYIVAIKMKGRRLKETLEHGVSALGLGEGRFPQVSGLVFTYSASAPPGSRVKEVLVGCRPLDPDKEYVVAANDFMVAGGDGYSTFGDVVRESGGVSAEGVTKGREVVYSDSRRWLRDLVIEYIKENREISPAVEGRIIELP